MPSRRRQGSRSRKSSQNLKVQQQQNDDSTTTNSGAASAIQQKPNKKHENLQNNENSSNQTYNQISLAPNTSLPIKSIQFQSPKAANQNDHYATFLQILSSHPNITCSTFSPNGKKCTLVFNSVQNCERWLLAFSQAKFKNHCIELLSNTFKPPSESRLTLQIYKIDVKQFKATTSFEKIPMFRITPLSSSGNSGEIANSQAQSLADLVTSDYFFGKANFKEKVVGIQFKEKSEAERFLDILKNVKLDFKYLVVEALSLNDDGSRAEKC